MVHCLAPVAMRRWRYRISVQRSLEVKRREVPEPGGLLLFQHVSPRAADNLGVCLSTH